MNVWRGVAALMLLLAAGVSPGRAQGGGAFDLQAYKTFLASHRDLTHAGMSALYPAGTFTLNVPTQATDPAYFSRIDSLYTLTSYEKQLLQAHGFVVTERLKRGSFGYAFLEAYHADLPVFVSADAILHAFHMSYDALLKSVEEKVLIRNLDTLLTRLHAALPELAQRYSGTPGVLTALKDADLYLTVPRRLLGGSVAPIFAENLGVVLSLEEQIAAAQPQDVALFGSATRTIDFSQFTPRGHYTDKETLRRYFQAMIWLGRTELYCGAPKSAGSGVPEADLQRQTIVSVLLLDALTASSSWDLLNEMDAILQGFVGEQDNITPAHLRKFVTEGGLTDASQLADITRWRTFQSGLLAHSYAVQRINSQILWSDPNNPDQIQPAAAFLLLGQRFIVDSYVTGNVVYDRILYQGQKVRRMLPSTLDILFALGNDAAGQLLQTEMERYPYATNLAALRYLIDGYEPGYWDQTLYAGWLHALRALSPPSQRTNLPPLMQTAAWWQKGMNTQLASWAQLRHDNLLYSKQSYTGGIVCSFPESFVEPVPEFFRRMRSLADAGKALFQRESLADISRTAEYFVQMGVIMDTLASVAGKQRIGEAPTEDELSFLHRMIYDVPSGCTTKPEGWYVRLYYTGEEGLKKNDRVVADVHTAPTDEAGGLVGWVLHGGTGPVNMAVVIAPCSDGTATAFAGPVTSYYEYVSTNFKRLTDEEWESQYQATSAFRPSWVNLYLADAKGGSRGTGAMLLTAVPVGPDPGTQPQGFSLLQNFPNPFNPNPFNPSTIISFTVPFGNGPASADITIFDIQGRQVRRLFAEEVPPGAYSVRWDGTNDAGRAAASGVLFYRLRVNDFTTTRSMLLVR